MAQQRNQDHIQLLDGYAHHGIRLCSQQGTMEPASVQKPVNGRLHVLVPHPRMPVPVLIMHVLCVGFLDKAVNVLVPAGDSVFPEL
jgi:hypothetical protein